MGAAESYARAIGRTLLVLDTATAAAERLYERLGWSRCGAIPGYALNPDGTKCDTTVYWKSLDERPGMAAAQPTSRAGSSVPR
jgi:hypothetical protein